MTTEQEQYSLRQGDTPHQILFPAIDDVFILPFDAPWATDEEKKRRRRQQWAIIANSPTPDVVKKTQRWAQATDNVQDFLVTVDVALRISLRVMKRWAPRLAPQVLKYSIPKLGWLLLIGDLLNLATGVLSLPSGPWALKHLIEAAIQGMPGRTKSMKKAATKLARLTTTWRDWIQVAQTSEWVTGVGLRLGGIMGFITDCVYGIVPGSSEIIYPWDRPGTLERKAYRALQGCIETAQYWEWLPLQDVARLALAAEEAMNVLASQAHACEWPDNALANENVPWVTHHYMPDDWYDEFHDPGEGADQAKQIQDPNSIAVLQEMGLDPEANVGFIGKETGTTTVGQVLAGDPSTFGQPLIDAVSKYSYNWQSLLGLHAIAQNDEAICSIMDENPADSSVFIDGEIRGIPYTFYHNMYPPDDLPKDEIIAGWQEVSDFIVDNKRLPNDVDMCEILFRRWRDVKRSRASVETIPWEILP